MDWKKEKKSHYNCLVSLHQAPTENTEFGNKAIRKVFLTKFSKSSSSRIVRKQPEIALYTRKTLCSLKIETGSFWVRLKTTFEKSQIVPDSQNSNSRFLRDNTQCFSDITSKRRIRRDGTKGSPFLNLSWLLRCSLKIRVVGE